jgi:hypothetical protein
MHYCLRSEFAIVLPCAVQLFFCYKIGNVTPIIMLYVGGLLGCGIIAVEAI